MGWLQNILGQKTPEPVAEVKAAPSAEADVQPSIAYSVPVGVQGKPQAAPTDIGSLLSLYGKNEIIFACVRAKAQATIGPRLTVQLRGKEDTWKEEPGHPLQRLLMRPNPDMDGAEFMQAATICLNVAGVFYAEIVRSERTGLPIALYPLNPTKLKPVPNKEGGVDEYEWKDGQTKEYIPARDILVRRAYNPSNRWYGLAALAVGSNSASADIAQTEYTRAFFDNAGVASGLLTSDQSLSEPEGQRYQAMWNAKHGRGRWHDIAVLGKGLTYQRMGANLDELASDLLYNISESRLCMLFGVPPQIVGALVGLQFSTYSNWREAREFFWENTLMPEFALWDSFFTWHLLNEFESTENIYAGRVRLAWDMSLVPAMQDDVDAVQERARKNLQAGAMTVEKFQELIGLDPDPYGNYYLRSIAMVAVPAGQPLPDLTVDTGEPAKSRAMLQVKAYARATRAAKKPVINRIESAAKRYLNGQYEAAAKAAEGSTA